MQTNFLPPLPRKTCSKESLLPLLPRQLAQHKRLLLVRLPSAPSFHRTAKSHQLLNGSYPWRLQKTVPQHFQRNDPKFCLWRHKPFHKNTTKQTTAIQKLLKQRPIANECETFDVTTNESAGKLHAHLEQVFMMADAL